MGKMGGQVRGLTAFLIMMSLLAIGTSCFFRGELPPDATSSLEIGTWNLAWFADGNPSTCQNEERFERTDQDVQALAAFIDSMGLEVLALQEIENQAALDRLLGYLPAGKYRGILGSKPMCQSVAVLYQPAAVQMEFDSEIAALASSSGLRPGLVVRGQWVRGGFDFLMVVVHLKAFNDPDSTNVRFDQMRNLNEWLKLALADTSKERDLVLLGDFNEDLLTDPEFFQALSQGLDQRLLTEELSLTRCSPQEKVYVDPIDHILVSGGAKDRFEGTVVMENVFEFPSILKDVRDRFSDHCPVWARFRS